MKHLLTIAMFITIAVAATANPYSWSEYTEAEKQAFAMGVVAQSFVALEYSQTKTVETMQQIITTSITSISDGGRLFRPSEIAGVMDLVFNDRDNDNPFELWEVIAQIAEIEVREATEVKEK